MTRRRRRVLVRVAGVLGVCSQVLVGLMGIVIFPAAFVSFFAGGAGVRLVARDLEAASMRFGIALLASGVGLLAGAASGALPMVVAAVLSTGSFGVAWYLVQHLGQEDRAEFGIRHRDWVQRNEELHRRREDLTNRRREPDPEPEGMSHRPATGGARAAGEADDWWDDLE